MQFDFGLVTGTEIEGSDLFGDTQIVVKSLTTIWNSFRFIGDARWQGKQPFRRKMSGIRDKCPEFGTHVPSTPDMIKHRNSSK